MTLEGKVALVTGASRGIGRSIAGRLAREGAAVVVNYSGSREDAEAVVAAVESSGGRAFAIRADIGRVAEVERLFEESIGHFGKIDVLVNNAGILALAPIAEVTEEEFDRMFAINVKGTFFACQQAARRMAQGGRIINFSSSTTARIMPTYGAYVATKGAVEQLSRSLSKELGPKGITVNVVAPGPTETELFLKGKTDEVIRQMAEMSAFNRLGKPDDIADVVAFLAGEDARWITGQTILVNGGLA